MRICVFTSVYHDGGVSQFAVTLADTYWKLGYDVVFSLPEGNETVIPNALEVKYYHVHASHILIWRNVRSIATWMNEEAFDFIIFADNFNLSSCVIPKVKKKLAVVIHDVNPHASNMGVIYNIRTKIIESRMKAVLKAVGHVILLSENSFNMFGNRYPGYEAKAIKMNLGAHIPIVDFAEHPFELSEALIEQDKFLLFFGRIDKYKGIPILIDAYNSTSQELNLIISGQIMGACSYDLKETEKMKFLNRFIRNEEMAWLFEHAKFCVLPYIEATQSGVLPIAYSYGIPVIASDVPGLNEFVVNEKTGFLFQPGDASSLAEILEKCYELNDFEYKNMQNNVKKYYFENFSWEKNLSEAMIKIAGKTISK